jgi:two-component system, cell cycle response regulator DivK
MSAQPTGAHILIVDDFDDAREMYAEFLSSVGHRVVSVGDGQAALETAMSEPFDLIILDIALPKLDGISVIKRLRAREATRRTPIITLSASVEEEVRMSAVEAGADLALDKPCLPMELETAVRVLLQRGKRSLGPEARTRPKPDR